jgi:hypothetical protein
MNIGTCAMAQVLRAKGNYMFRQIHYLFLQREFPDPIKQGIASNGLELAA